MKPKTIEWQGRKVYVPVKVLVVDDDPDNASAILSLGKPEAYDRAGLVRGSVAWVLARDFDEAVSRFALPKDGKELPIPAFLTRFLNKDLGIELSFEEAQAVAATRAGQFDVVLTDMMMPKAKPSGDDHWRNPDLYHQKTAIQAFGWPLAVYASQQGVQAIGIVSDLDHHGDAMAMAMRQVSARPITVNNVPVRIIPAPKCELGGKQVKDWLEALKQLESAIESKLVPRAA